MTVKGTSRVRRKLRIHAFKKVHVKSPPMEAKNPILLSPPLGGRGFV